jgi:hypothetical protein
MSNVVFIDDDFRRMLRTDMQHLQRLIDRGKFGKHTIPYKGATIKVEITKKDNTIVVKKIRIM